MLDKFFKITSLIIGCLIVAALISIYITLNEGRYEMNSNRSIINTKTGQVYFLERDGYSTYENGERKYIHKLP